MIRKFHPFFLLNIRPWPLLIRFNAFSILFSFILFIKFSILNCFVFRIFNTTISCFLWWILYRGEFNLEGKTSMNLEQGLKFSIILFISSEIFFFFSFFWSYFHFFLSPTIETGLIWPPYRVVIFNCLNVPLINTLVLITSGVTVTLRHHYMIKGIKKISNIFLFSTIMLGFIFTLLQVIEYYRSFFRMRDRTFGRSFFLLTGFHGIHVLIGTSFLATILYRFFKLISRKNDCVRFELSSWYWHFVDVVWLFLFMSMYYWGS